MEWKKNQIQINPPKKPKKITGTRFASVLGYNPWSTPFEAWCAITRTYEKPFEDTIYTKAGKTIEPKQIEYLKKSYAMTNIVTPTDVYGEDYFNKTWGDFFPDDPVFGGMWDALEKEDGEVKTVIEFKTTKRSEDWKEDVPDYYALQAALYAHELGVDDVIMVVSFLKEEDYDHPADYVPSVENTKPIIFKVSERYPKFDEMVTKALLWWNNHVNKGLSPVFDEKRDAEILKELRTTSLSPDTDIEELIKEGEQLKIEIEDVTNSIADKEKRLKEISKIVKEYGMSQFKDGDKKVVVSGNKFDWCVSKSDRKVIDEEALKQDEIFDKYVSYTPSFSLRFTSKGD